MAVPVEIIVSICLAVWAATSALMTGSKLVNERRDVVVIGKLKNEPLTREHRALILYSDWVPMAFGVGVVLRGAILGLSVLPWVFMGKEWYSIGLSMLGCLTFVVVGGLYLYGVVAEFKLMKQALEVSDKPGATG